jgi:ribosomal protein L7/L12
MLLKFGIALLVAVIILLVRSWVVGGRLESAERRHRASQDRETDKYLEQLIRQNRKTEAIRVYRAVHGVDQTTARDAVEKKAARAGGRD